MQNVVPHCEGMQKHVDAVVVAVKENFSVSEKKKKTTTSYRDLLVVPCLPTLSVQIPHDEAVQQILG